jgi:autophagy-related protein 9
MNDLDNITYSSLFEFDINTDNIITKDKDFYKDIYSYYIKGGFYNIIVGDIIEIMSLIFSIIFILITFLILDWKNIILCGKTYDKNDKSIKDCGDISDYFTFEYLFVPTFFQGLILTFISGIILYVFYKFVHLYFEWSKFYKIDRYYVNTLKIPRNYLHSKSWEDIILLLSTYNKISYDDITNIILKSENFFISFVDNNIFKVSNGDFTKQLEYNLYYCFDPPTLINKDSEHIRKKLLTLCALNIIFSPFIMMYIIMSFIFSNIDELYINKKVFGPRRYTPYFKWKIRQYNELEHYFQDRINMSIKYANEYTKQFPSIMVENISKFVAFISGAFIFIFLIFSILDENILLYVKFMDRSLIFYTGLIGTISAITRGFIKEPEHSVYDPNKAMEKLSKYTLYLPDNWKDNANNISIRNEFFSFFNYILVIFFYEILGILRTPYVLFQISKEHKNIENFIRHNIIYIKNVGNISLSSDFKNKSNMSDKLSSSITSFSDNYKTWQK